MSSFYSRDEIDEIGEGLIQVYKNQYPSKVISYIYIEHFITAFLGLDIEFVTFAEKDLGKIGFTSDGNAELMICQNGRIISFVFPEKNIIIDKFLLSEKEYGRRRFIMAHEAAHIILNKMEQSNKSHFHNEFDNERAYSVDELRQMFSNAEWQADAMAASLLMPRFLVERALVNSIKVYGENILSNKDKKIIKDVSAFLGVSQSALIIRLEHLNMVEKLDMTEFVYKEILQGGVLH